MENIKKLAEEKNFEDSVKFLIEKLEIDETTYKGEIKCLKNKINLLEGKVQVLENSNRILFKTRNRKVVKQKCSKLVSLLEKNDLDSFKNLVEEVSYPLNAHCDEDLSDIRHLTLLQYAINLGRIDFIEYLVESGVDVNLPDKKDSWTPIMYAIQSQNTDVVKFLMSHGASVDVKDVDGFTPLAISVDERNMELVKLILSVKPKIDDPKETVMMAVAYEDQDLQNVLEDYFNYKLSYD